MRESNACGLVGRSFQLPHSEFFSRFLAPLAGVVMPLYTAVVHSAAMGAKGSFDAAASDVTGLLTAFVEELLTTVGTVEIMQFLDSTCRRSRNIRNRIGMFDQCHVSPNGKLRSFHNRRNFSDAPAFAGHLLNLGDLFQFQFVNHDVPIFSPGGLFSAGGLYMLSACMVCSSNDARLSSALAPYHICISLVSAS